MREIIRASAWNGFTAFVDSLGGDGEMILAAVQLDPKLLEDGERYLPLKQFIEAQALAAERLKRKDFGLRLGQSQTMSVLGPLSIAIINSPTARHGIEIAARFMHVHNPNFVMSLTPAPDSNLELLGCALKLRDDSRREQNDERILSNVHKSLQQMGGERYRPQEVWFTHAPISPMSVYREIFGVAPKFNQPAMGIMLDRNVLDSWRPGGSSQMRDIAEKYLIERSVTQDKVYTKSVASMARSLMRGGEFTPEQTAKALGVHARTLQRRLRDEGTSFEKIKDDARREWAESLLVQPSVSLSQIALMLGYADPSAFSRSCRRWFGEAPRTYRLRMAGRSRMQAGPRLSRVNSLEANLRARKRAGV